MSYYKSYDAAKTCRYHFLLEELLSLCNTVPATKYKRGRPVEYPLPALFVLLELKFDTGFSYPDFVAFVDFNPYLSHRLGFDRTPSYSSIHKALKRIDIQLLHRMYVLLARKKPPPENLAVDSSGFSHSTGGE
jgi:hypothetical protein